MSVLSIKLSRETSSKILSTKKVEGLKKLRSTVSRVARDTPLAFKVCLWVLVEDLAAFRAGPSSLRKVWENKADLVFDLEGDAYVSLPYEGTKNIVLDALGDLAERLGTEALIRNKIIPASFRSIRLNQAQRVCRTFGIGMECDSPILEALCASIILP